MRHCIEIVENRSKDALKIAFETIHTAHGFGVDFRSIWGQFFCPFWHKKPIKKAIRKVIDVDEHLGTDFDRFWAPKPPPAGPR